MITKICPQCNRQYLTEYKTQKFCSKACLGLSLSRKIWITCPTCGKAKYAEKGTKFCSKECANTSRRGVRLSPPVIKICPVCNNPFERKSESQKFCSRKCGNEGRSRPPIHAISEEERLAMSDRLKQQWKDEKFRQIVVNRMKTNNPVYMDGVVEKAQATRAKNKSYSNNFRYGNGKISPYEQFVLDELIDLGFIYNYAIKTRDARKAHPDENYAVNYKPDFVNLENKLCIEIDGYGHSSRKEKAIDAKKERCLTFLGYKVIRFTHEDIDKGVFDEWLNSYRKDT